MHFVAEWRAGLVRRKGHPCVRDCASLKMTQAASTAQDRVPAFPVEKAIAIITRELGAPPDELFASFTLRPIAAASLGQVRAWGRALPNRHLSLERTDVHCRLRLVH
jgi:hypothetical protein